MGEVVIAPREGFSERVPGGLAKTLKGQSSIWRDSSRPGNKKGGGRVKKGERRVRSPVR